jgi:tetratricopeptide (TPR) repeat protein
MLFRLWPVLFIPLIAAVLCSCDTPKGTEVDEQKNPHFIEGKERAKARDVKGAIEAFQHALDANPNSALAHFELGMLYENNDERNEWRYVLALYHYYRAYELRPNAYPADNAKVRIQACRQELAKTESVAPLYPAMQRDLERLREENLQLKKQVDYLQGQVLARTALSNQTFASISHSQTVSTFEAVDPNRGSGPAPHSERPAAATPATGKKHTVREKETFASIARTYHIRLESLIAANPSIEPKRLRAGQTLNVPGP